MIWDGTSEAESYQGTSQSDVLRGKAGNDTLTGGLGQDVFVLEATLAANGVDEIVDFQVKNRCSTGDILDLSAVFGSKLNSRNLNQYVRIAGNKLQLDIDGPSCPAQWVDWAILSGVKEGDHVTIRSRRFTGVIRAGKEDRDSTAPSFDPSGSYTFDYQELQSEGAVVATVIATDNIGVTNYRFAPSSADADDPTLSADKYYRIGNDGKITLTALGAASAANDFEDVSGVGSTAVNSRSYDVQAGDAAGNWSASQSITLDETDKDPRYFTVGLSSPGVIGSVAVWEDSLTDGVLGVYEAAYDQLVTVSSNKISGLTMNDTEVTVRYSVTTGPYLDLGGFGADDKIVLDYATNVISGNVLGNDINVAPTQFGDYRPYNYSNFSSGMIFKFVKTATTANTASGSPVYRGDATGAGLGVTRRSVYGYTGNGLAKYAISNGNDTLANNAGNLRYVNWLTGTGEDGQLNVRGLAYINYNSPTVEFIVPEFFDYYVTVGRDGVWLEDPQAANGILDGDETLATVTDANSDGFYTVNGVNYSTKKVFVRVVDATTPNPLDLTGFGSGDKLIIDGKTNQSSYYGLVSKFAGLAYSPSISSGEFSTSSGSTAYVQMDDYFSVGGVGYLRQAYIGISSTSGRLNGYGFSGKTSPSTTFFSSSPALAKGLGSGYKIEVISPAVI